VTPLWVAVQMLTCIPVRLREFDAAMMRAAPVWFPCVGALIGGLLWAAHALLSRVVPGILESALLVALSVRLTGGLHQDALADTVDGLAGGKTPGDTLRIMSDPHIGALGTTALVLALGTRAVCLATLPAAWLGPSLLAAAIFGRTALVAALCLPPVRGGGLGQACAQPRTVGRLAICAVGACLVPLVTFGPVGLIAAALGIAPAALVLRTAHARLGGMTGDVCGAAGELGEVGFLVGCASLLAPAGGAAA
jgi:adenosylcobinamide-GDP ribazoletransferase